MTITKKEYHITPCCGCILWKFGDIETFMWSRRNDSICPHCGQKQKATPKPKEEVA